MVFGKHNWLSGSEERKADRLRRRALHFLEVLEDRLAPAVIVLDSVQTTDSREAIVNYDITAAIVTKPFAIQIFRSDQSTYSRTDLNNVAVGDAYTVTTLTPGHYTIKIDLPSRVSGEAVAPVEPLASDPKLPYVLAVADPQRTLPAGITIDETQAHFRIYVIADVTQGFGASKAPWVQDMVDQLIAIGYDSVEPLYWNSFLTESGQTVLGGDDLYAQLIAQADGLLAKVQAIDVIDVQLVGHSRGTAVVARAMQDLVDQVNFEPHQLLEGYYELTLLDPHPANSNTVKDVSISTVVPGFATEAIVGYALLSDTYDDPPIVVASRVNQVEVYYAQTPVNNLSIAATNRNPLEASFNLWGDPSQITIEDPTQTVYHQYNLTFLGLGHSDIWQWYMKNVIFLLATGSPPPVQPSSGSSSPPTSGGLNLEQFFFPEFVNDQSEADALVNDFTTASNDLDQGNTAQCISDLEFFDATIQSAPTSDFTNGTYPLLSASQNLIDELGPIPSSSPNTIYWTGLAGPDAVGDYDWDESGNWSTVDPLVDKVPQDILPGPDDNVVIDLAGANIVHADDIDDTISSLTVTAQNVFLDLFGGTLDLSGGGAPGTFQVPGNVDFSNNQYGNVDLNGGVLANANVTQDTAIGVLGDLTPALAAEEEGTIDGGVLNGTIEVNDGGYATLNLIGGWVNNGTITVNSSNLNLGDNSDTGSDASGGASDAWVNNGTISTNNCVVELGGSLTSDPSVNNLATLNLSTDTVYLSGTLDNTGRTLTFSQGVTSASGSWTLDGGTIVGGTITGSPLFTGGGILNGLTNDGSIDINNSYPVTIEGSWVNSGTIAVASGATVNLGGAFTTDTFDGLSIEAGATVNLTGKLDNSAADNPQSDGTLALDDSTGPLSLDGGEIYQGEITTSGNNDLVATTGGGTLDGVTLDGTLDMTQFMGAFTLAQFSGSLVNVSNGLTLNGTIELGGASGTSNAGDLVFGSLDDDVAQTISGSGTIQFGQDNAGDVLFNTSNDPLTVGPNITIQGGLHSYIEAPAAAIVNQGTIENTSGGSLAFQADLTNAGTIDPGTGTMTVTNYTQTSSGVLNIAIGATSQFGNLVIASIAQLDGTLNVTLVNGYIPNVGDAFQILAFGQLLGDFAAMNGLDAGGGNQFSPDHSNTALTLTVSNNGNAPNPIVYWTGDAGDNNWDNPANWSSDDPLVNNVPESILPGPFDNVVIDLPAQIINHSATSYDTISNLTVTGQFVTLNLAAGTLDLSGGGGMGTIQVAQSGDTVNLQGADLKSAIITSGTTVTATSSGGVLDNVQLNGTLDMTKYNDAYVQVIDAFTLDGAIELGSSSNYAALYFGYQNDFVGMTVAGTGAIQFGPGRTNDDLYNVGAGTLTFGPKITIQGGFSSFILAYNASSGPIANAGTIEENTAKGQLTINLVGWVNEGSIAVSNGATVTLAGFWSNSSTGQITATDATLNLSGAWTNYGTIVVDPSTISLGSSISISPTDPSAFTYYWSNQGTLSIDSGSTVNLGGILTTDQFNVLIGQFQAGGQSLGGLIGTLDNNAADNPTSGGVLALGASTGPLTLDGGEIYQGEITTDGANDLVATTLGGTLDGVTLSGTFDMTQYQGSSATVLDGLNLNGTIELGGVDNTTDYADLYFGSSGDNVPQTVAGTGSIQFGAAYYQFPNSNGHAGAFVYTTIYNDSDDILTFGPSITIEGASSNNSYGPVNIESSSGGIDNQGTIGASAGGSVTINAVHWVNDGSIQFGSGGVLSLYGSWTNNGTITVSEAGFVSLGSPTSVALTDPSASAYSWSSPGAISITDGSYLYLGGVFTTDTFYGLVGDLQAHGESLANDGVTLEGTLDNSVADNPQSGGVLALNASTGPLDFGSAFSGIAASEVSNGRIYQGEITTSGSDVLRATGGFNPTLVTAPTLDGVTLDGTLNESGGAVTIVNGLTLNGTILDANLYFGNTEDNIAQTVSGTGTIALGGVFNNVINLFIVSNDTLTFGPNITIQGGGIFAAYYPFPGKTPDSGPIDNQGMIVDNTSGSQLTIVVDGWVNDGSVAVGNGATITLEGKGWSNGTTGQITATAGTLNLYGSWTNDGSITVGPGAGAASTVSLGSPINIVPTDPSAPNYNWTSPGMLAIAAGSTVNLGGVFTTDEYDDAFVVRGVTVNLSQITFNLTGSLDNSAADNPQSGGTLALGASTGPLNLAGGRTFQGTITTSGSDDLVTAGLGNSTLDGVTLDGTLDMTQAASINVVDVINGMTLNGTIDLGGGASSPAELTFDATKDDGAETLGGTGTIQFGLDEFDTISSETTATITFGPHITIQAGLSALVQANQGAFDNQGTIAENVSGGQLLISAVGWVNDGLIEVSSGASATLWGQRFVASTLTYLVASWTNNGTITAAAGSTLNLYGGWTNLGTITVDSSTVGLGSPVFIDPTSSAATAYAWTNAGTLTIADGASVNLGGVFTTDAFADDFANVGGAIDLAKDTVNLTGSLDNSPADNPVTDGVLALNASTGPLYLAGLIYAGTIATSSSHDLVANHPGVGGVGVYPVLGPTFYGRYDFVHGNLDGVTLDGTLDVTQSPAFATVINGLTLDGTIEVGGPVGIANSSSELFFGAENDGVAQTIGGTGTIQLGQDPAGDGLANVSSATLTFGPNITIQAGLNSAISGNTLEDYGYGLAFEAPIEVEGTIEENTNGGTLTGDSHLDVGHSTNPFVNWSGATLTGGTWEVSNGAKILFDDYSASPTQAGFPSLPIVTNAATLILNGANSAFEDFDGSNALAGLTTNSAQGSLTVAAGNTFTAPGDFSNAGALIVGSGGAFSTGTADYIQSSGTTTVDGTLSAANVTLDGGALNGTGAIQGNLTNAATILPGDAPGTLTVQGNYTQAAAGALNIDLDGTSQFGQLAVSGTATLDGTLNVSLSNTYTPNSGDSFKILTFASRSGDFATVNGLNLPNGDFFVPLYHSDDLTLLAVGNATAVTHFAIRAPSTATAGTPFTYTVTAEDQFNNTVTGYTGTVHFTSSDTNSKLMLPADSTLTDGTGAFSAMLVTAGDQTIAATDTVISAITDSSNTINVSAAAAMQFAVSAPVTATAGTPFTFTIIAEDQFDNTATGYTGTVHFTASDRSGQVVLPPNSKLTDGAGSFSATLITAGSQSITATDTVASAISRTSNAIAASAAAATHFVVSAPATAAVGTAFSFTVTAKDQFENTATGYAGTVHFTSSDANASLPSNSPLTDGTGTLTAILKTVGNQMLTATDSVTSSISGSSSAINVSTTSMSMTPNQLFIAHVYSTLFGRAVDPGGLSYWTGFLTQGVSRNQTALEIEFAYPNEYQTIQVKHLYQRYLHRSADAVGLQYGVAFLDKGGTVEQLTSMMVSSPEFLADTGATNAGFLNALYEDALGRAIDARGSASWGELLTQGNSRYAVALKILSSTEYYSNLVDSYYEQFLQRPDDPGGLASFLNQLQSGITDQEVIAAILGSQEFYAKSQLV